MTNYIKVLFLIPDSMYERTVGNTGVDELYDVFKDYQQLDSLSLGGFGINKKSIFMLHTSDPFFNYIHDQLCFKSINNVRLHIIEAERKMVLCLNFKEFKHMVESYTQSLKRVRIKLLNDLSDNNEELLYSRKLSQGCEILSAPKEEGRSVMDMSAFDSGICTLSNDKELDKLCG